MILIFIPMLVLVVFLVSNSKDEIIICTLTASICNYLCYFRRALKATFVLLPLFGIQLFVTIYRLPPGTPGEANYEQFTIFVMNSQVRYHSFELKDIPLFIHICLSSSYFFGQLLLY